ncbi:outer membrane beta-barrel protein [Tenacibaculum piscium]|uniref:outer membrane beta-barrel protein n=1 Tax=Tenacibaculum piscium TaxID=1458515 RepID=UPI001F34CEF7|nr:outer membrane beta-barrel protein [Tenacibaculum piscium]
MNKVFLTAVIAFASLSASAQFYVSASSGYSFSAVESKMGTKTTLGGVENTYGSYGEGTHTQVRGGYFFNDKWGIETAVGYLHGADQTSILVDIPGQTFVDVKSRGRAFGLSISTVYNITEHFYGRAGALTKIAGKTEVVGKIKADLPAALTKIAGKTEVVGKIKADLPAALLNPLAPAGATAPLDIDLTREFKGRFPIGFIGAIGYKHEILKNLQVFGEVEYLGISVTRNTSEISDFSATLAGASKTREELLQVINAKPVLKASFGQLLPLINDKINYEDSLTLQEAQAQDPLATKQLSQTVPYSSWGLNFGFTYTFGNGKKKEAEAKI